jgi:hypothetical protein
MTQHWREFDTKEIGMKFNEQRIRAVSFTLKYILLHTLFEVKRPNVYLHIYHGLQNSLAMLDAVMLAVR